MYFYLDIFFTLSHLFITLLNHRICTFSKCCQKNFPGWLCSGRRVLLPHPGQKSREEAKLFQKRNLLRTGWEEDKRSELDRVGLPELLLGPGFYRAGFSPADAERILLFFRFPSWAGTGWHRCRHIGLGSIWRETLILSRRWSRSNWKIHIRVVQSISVT